MNPSGALLRVSVLGAVVAAAVVTGAVVGTVRAVDDGVVAAVPPPRAAPVAPLPDPATDPVPDREPVREPVTTTRLALGAAGSVLLAADGGRLVVRQVDPAAGWSVDKVDDGGRQVDVRLRSGHAEARAEAVLSDGRVVVTRLRVRER